MIGPGLALSQHRPMGVLSKFGRSSAPAFLFSGTRKRFLIPIIRKPSRALWTVPPLLHRLRGLSNCWERLVGKGDRRTRRGKIYAGSFGKTRPKDPKKGKSPATAKRPAAPKAAAKPAAKPAAKRAAK